MRQYSQRTARFTLTWWATAFLLVLPLVSSAGEAPAAPNAPQPPRSVGLDRQAIERELTRSPATLQAESGEGLRAYLSRLEQIRSALETAPDISASERRTLSDQLLARVVEVGLMLRQRTPGPPGASGSSGESRAGGRLLLGVEPAAVLADNSILLMGLLGGVVVAFALGGLVGYRRGSRQATYYGEGDPRIRFLARAPAHPVGPGKPPVITLARIREALVAGRPVQLQLGYEIAPSHRPRFLELMRQAQQIMQGVEGQHYTVWEDPRHPNRFYEVLVCRQASALAPLTQPNGPLARIAEEIERCRVLGGLMVRRVWWEVPREGAVSAGPASSAGDSSERKTGK